MSIFDTALHIPHEPRFFEAPSGALDRVSLPLSARPTWRVLAMAALAIFASVACLGVGGAVAVIGGGALGFGFVLIAGAVLPAGIAIVALRDATSAQPCLVIDRDGIFDRRIDVPRITWPEVVAAELMASANGIDAVRLTLDRDGPPRFNPLRIGGWTADWGRRRRVRTIALRLLDVRSHALAHTILTLTARHGATAISQTLNPSIAPAPRA